MFKKQKIRKYLEETEHFTPFDYLLQDYLSGEFKQRLADMQLSRIDIYVDWEHRCVSVYARYGDKWCLDVQANPEELMVAVDEDEPEDGVFLQVPSEGDSASFYYDAIAEHLRQYANN